MRITGNMVDSVWWVFKAIRVLRTNRASIKPSRHRREDIMCDRYNSSPRRAMVNAKRMLM